MIRLLMVASLLVACSDTSVQKGLQLDSSGAFDQDSAVDYGQTCT